MILFSNAKITEAYIALFSLCPYNFPDSSLDNNPHFWTILHKSDYGLLSFFSFAFPVVLRRNTEILLETLAEILRGSKAEPVGNLRYIII